MSSYVCPTCHNYIAANTQKCPHCGQKFYIPQLNHCVINGLDYDLTRIACHLEDMRRAGFVGDNGSFLVARYANLDYENGAYLWEIIKEQGGIPTSYRPLTVQQIESERRLKLERNQVVNRPKCPTCGSTNLQKLNAATRAIDGWFFGRHSVEGRAQFWCKNCNYRW